MDCREARDCLIEYQRDRLAPDLRRLVDEHLHGCADCRRAADVESALTRALRERLPRHAPPVGLRAAVEARAATRAAHQLARTRRLVAPIASAFGAAATVLLIVRLTQPAFLLSDRAHPFDLVAEGVNDHLRVVGSLHPLEVEGGGIHQVKPWFTGRLDFAPPVSFAGDADFQLEGGNVGYFGDRKAAVFVFKHRLHTLSLFVFRADGLSWPSPSSSAASALPGAYARAERGFTTLLWRRGDLGYCLVSDVNRAALDSLAMKIADGT